MKINYQISDWFALTLTQITKKTSNKREQKYRNKLLNWQRSRKWLRVHCSKYMSKQPYVQNKHFIYERHLTRELLARGLALEWRKCMKTTFRKQLFEVVNIDIFLWKVQLSTVNLRLLLYLLPVHSVGNWNLQKIRKIMTF